jgi:hypothetical protein
MSYIGNSPITQAFLTDTFSGNGSNLVFTLTIAPATSSSIIVAVSGVLQDPSTYGVSGTTLTFSGAPPAGTNNISVRYLGIPSTGVTTTAYRTLTQFTATANQTSFTIPNYTVGYLDVYQNGVLLGTADYTANNGVNVVLNTGATAGDLMAMESFYVSSVLNAVPATGGNFTGAVEFSGGIINGANITGGSVVTGGMYSTGAYAGSYSDGVVVDYITGNARISAGSADNVTIYTDGLANVQIVAMSNTVTNFGSQTGALVVPTGTTAQRAASNGAIRYNSSLNVLEAYANGTWITFAGTVPTYTISYLLVAGGGGGGNAVYAVDNGGGGGAGGMLTGTTSLSLGTTYTVTVGAGGANTARGSNTIALSLTAIGGGFGGTDSVTAGGSGGSGGGGAGITVTAGGSGTAGQGSNGGTGSSSYGAGGGGASAAGTNGPSGSTGGPGGNGNASSITGSSVTYAGGGGGGGGSSRAAGGSGGGGQGGGGSGQLPTAGTANLGGGGGGGTGNDSGNSAGAAGGSGVVIFSIPTASYSGTYSGSNTVVTTSGSNTIVSFYSSGSYTA